MNYLTSCGRCGGHHIGHNSRSFEGTYFCPKCLPIIRPIDWRPAVNDCVRLIDGNYGRRWVVLAMDGDIATLRQLGMPEAPNWAINIHNLWPTP